METVDVPRPLQFSLPHGLVMWASHKVFLRRLNSGLGMMISAMRSPWGNHQSAHVTSFKPNSDGCPGPAAASGQLKVGDIICGVNGVSVEKTTFAETVKIISEVGGSHLAWSLSLSHSSTRQILSHLYWHSFFIVLHKTHKTGIFGGMVGHIPVFIQCTPQLHLYA
jgi:hypothetical protein